MNGFIKRALSAAVMVGGLSAAGGCLPRYHDVVDPCYPQRYNYAARLEVVEPFGRQVCNGHILDQTLWNWHFVVGSDQLHPAGMDKLDQLVRTRPAPDPRLFLQTARDLAYDAADPEKFADARRDLDSRRILSVQKYVTAQTAGRPMHFEVIVHDPSPVGQSAVSAQRSASTYQQSARGTNAPLPASLGGFGGNPSGNIIFNSGPQGGGQPDGGQPGVGQPGVGQPDGGIPPPPK